MSKTKSHSLRGFRAPLIRASSWSLMAGAAFLGYSRGSHAYSARTVEIISRKNRTLPPPSKDITAYHENAIARYNSENRRLNKTDIEGVDNPDPSTHDRGTDIDESSSDDEEERPRRKKSAVTSTGFSGERSFAVGFVGGSNYGVFGLDFEAAIDPHWAVGGGLGTGMTYSTWGLHGKYYFSDENKVTPYLKFGYANWNMRRVSRNGEKGKPQYLTDRFFADKNGTVGSAKSRHLIYPGIGVSFLQESGLGLSAEILYLISLTNSVGGLYGGVGVHLFF